MNDICIVLVEDHDVVRIGLRTALQSQAGFKVVGEAINGVQGLKVLEMTQPDIAIVDIGLPGMDGIEMTRQFRQLQANKANSTTKVLMLTMQGNEDSVIAAFAAGADSYCMKDVGMERMIEAVKMTHTGNSWIDPAIANIVLRQMRNGTPRNPDKPKSTVEIQQLASEYKDVLDNYPLTHRELEVLELMVGGCTNVAIAERLYITTGTVKTHVRNILSKLCADDRTEAAVRALRAGIIS
jgi:two-component system, NarL family, response regulator LiaR